MMSHLEAHTQTHSCSHPLIHTDHAKVSFSMDWSVRYKPVQNLENVFILTLSGERERVDTATMIGRYFRSSSEIGCHVLSLSVRVFFSKQQHVSVCTSLLGLCVG